MPASLIKLYLGLTVDTTIGPTITRYKSTFAQGTYSTENSRYEFVVANFLNDTGDAPAQFPVLTDGYYNLYINGVLQQGGLSGFETTTFFIRMAQLDAQDTQIPIVLEFVTYDPISTMDSDVVIAPKP